MGWPVITAPIGLYRGDSRSLSWKVFAAPPAWVTGTAYVVGVVGSKTYLANSTVIEADVRYTCTTAHTSGASFDPTKWTADPVAVGAPVDFTAFGTLFTGNIRKGPDAPLLETMDLDISLASSGQLTAVVTPQSWTALTALTSVGWDIQIDNVAGTQRTTVLAGRFVISKDYTHA